MNYNQLPKYAPSNEAILPKHDELNPGPEMSKYDIQRHEGFKLRYPKRILGTRNRLPLDNCIECGRPVGGPDNIRFNGALYHGPCFVKKPPFERGPGCGSPKI